MTYSIGFIILSILIFFPGLLFRRLYFYSEFSKEFSSGIGLIELIARSSIPGVFIFILCFASYAWYDSDLVLNPVVDRLKEIIGGMPRNSDSIYSSKTNFHGKETDLIDEVKNAVPFLVWLYTISVLLGVSLGRLVRITGLDTKVKILRFNNFWFYLFNGYHGSFKKFKHLRRQPHEVFLFAAADVLIQANDKTHLYSGAIVDYELSESDGRSLKHIILEKAQRYSKKNGSTTKTDIPGDLFVLNCSEIKNINLNYYYKKVENKGFLNSEWPERIRTFLGFFYLFLLPFFLFETNFVRSTYYKEMFEHNIIQRMALYFILVEVLSFLDPYFYFKKLSGISFKKTITIKLILLSFFFLVLYFNKIIEWLSSIIF